MADCTCTKIDCDCGCQHTVEKNNCDKTKSKLEELLRDELCATESAPIREHLASCPECSAEKDICEALTDAVQRGCKEKAPTQLRDAILEALTLNVN